MVKAADFHINDIPKGSLILKVKGIKWWCLKARLGIIFVRIGCWLMNLGYEQEEDSDGDRPENPG